MLRKGDESEGTQSADGRTPYPHKEAVRSLNLETPEATHEMDGPDEGHN